jgi:adenylate cyclase
LLSLPGFDLVSHIGYADLLSDHDGAIRRYEITPRLDLAPELTEGAPSFSLGALLALRASKQRAAGDQWQIGSHTISAAQQANISYAGPPGTIRKIPISRLLADGAGSDPEVRALQGKVVIIGGDFFGMNDVHSTPYSGGMVGGLMTGPEVQANIAETLLSGKATESVPSWARWVLFASLIGMSLIAYTRMSPWVGLGVLTGGFLASLLLSLILFKFFYLFPAAHLQFGLVAGYMLSYGRRLTAEEREKGRIRHLFGRYVSDNVVDVLLESDRLPDLGGESVTITVLFSDIRNFTTISEMLNAQEVVEFLNHYFNLACEPILANGGTIDKFIGDAVMVQFGAPLAYPDHAAKALRTAVAMRQVAVEFRQWMKQRFPDRGLPEFAVGIGIHSGPAVVGNVGCTKRIDYTAIGDTVNQASRLESSSKTLGFDIVASADTLTAAGDVVRTGRHEVIKVKGKETPIEVFEIIGLME